MKVFISHVAADAHIARTIAEALNRHGHDVVSRDTSEKSLSEADAMVVLASKHAADSPFVLREIEYALQSRRYANRVIPVMGDATSRFPWVLRTFKGFELAGGYSELGDKIAKILGAAA